MSRTCFPTVVVVDVISITAVWRLPQMKEPPAVQRLATPTNNRTQTPNPTNKNKTRNTSTSSPGTSDPIVSGVQRARERRDQIRSPPERHGEDIGSVRLVSECHALRDFFCLWELFLFSAYRWTLVMRSVRME